MTTTYIVYNSASISNLNLANDTLKVVLLTSSYIPSIAHTSYSNLTNELTSANGYTKGGNVLQNPYWAQYNITTKFLNGVNPQWVASGGSLTASYAVIYKVGVVNGITNPLIACITLDVTNGFVTATNSTTITVSLPDIAISINAQMPHVYRGVCSNCHLIR